MSNKDLFNHKLRRPIENAKHYTHYTNLYCYLLFPKRYNYICKKLCTLNKPLLIFYIRLEIGTNTSKHLLPKKSPNPYTLIRQFL